jgi:glycine dehydrogenase subunit 1
MVCQLTGMDVANSGMYDGATSLAEAALMAARVTKRKRVVALDSVSPAYIDVLKTYLDAPGLLIDSAPGTGLQISDDTGCLIVQQPGFYGTFEDLQALSDAAHEAGALLVVVTDPISLGMFRPPSDYGADIVVGEGQALGIAPSFGGPYVGLFACRQQHIRQMPGRIVGKTVDTQGRTGYVLTMQTREQHIRRERATSNICTSVGLIALMATIYMIGQGRRGLAHIADLCYQKAHYAAGAIAALPGYSLATGDEVFFREFVVSCPLPPGEMNERLLEAGIIGGLDVSERFPNGMLLCFTEMNSREEIDSLVDALSKIGAESGTDDV